MMPAEPLLGNTVQPKKNNLQFARKVAILYGTDFILGGIAGAFGTAAFYMFTQEVFKNNPSGFEMQRQFIKIPLGFSIAATIVGAGLLMWGMQNNSDVDDDTEIVVIPSRYGFTNR